MTKMLIAMTFALGVLAAPAFAGETTVTLAVRNWYCAACPHVVKESLAAVPGVTNVAVSDKTKTAVVTFDDTKADMQALIKATTEAGYPSLPLFGRDAMAMKDHALVTAGAVGAVLAAICCAAPMLAVTLGTVSLTAGLAKAGYTVIPVLLVCLGLVAYRLNRRRTTTDCHTSTPNDQEIKSS